MARWSLNPLGMEPKRPGIEPKHPPMDWGGTGKGGQPRLAWPRPIPNPYSRRLARGSAVLARSATCAGSVPGPAPVPGLVGHRSVPKVFPVTMEPQELSPALLEPQVIVAVLLDELLAIVPSLEREMLLFESRVRLHSEVLRFGSEFQVTLYCTEVAWWRRNVTSDGDDPVTSLSRALATYKSTPGTRRKRVTKAVRKWKESVAVLRDGWAQLARKAIKLHNTCREVAAEVAASEATRATMVTQQVEVALGLLERLVAACEKAIAFPWWLQHLLRDTKAALKGTNEASHDIPRDLVAQVAVAEWLWEANTLLGEAVQDTIKLLFTGWSVSPSACGVAERCQRAIRDITSLLQTPETPQSETKMSPVSTELQELFPALLQPQVTVVDILGKLADTLPRWDITPLTSLEYLRSKLVDFSRKLGATMKSTDDTWWHRDVTSINKAPPASLSRALAAYENTPWTTWFHVTMEAWHWLGSLEKRLENSTELARAATELLNICRDLATEVTNLEATARARELQDEAARAGTAQENMVGLCQALGREEGAEVVAGREAQERREAWVAAREATRATMVRQRVEAAQGLLERLVAACDEATAFPRELQRRVGDIKATLEGANEESQDVPEDLVAKVAVAEWLWEANARLAKGHLLGTVDDISKFLFTGGATSPSTCGVAERCQRATEDIPRLLRPPECPQSVPKVSPVSMEIRELFPALLQPQVTVVDILAELADTLPRWDMTPLQSPEYLRSKLVDFSRKLRDTMKSIDDTWWHRDVTSINKAPPASLSRALAAYENTPWTTWDCVTMEAWHWLGSLEKHLENSTELARAATELLNICRDLFTEVTNLEATARARQRQALAACDGTAQENIVELFQALGREEGAEVLSMWEAQKRREARVAASEATRATMVRQRVEAALGLLERLVAACDEATAFPRELQWWLRDIMAILNETNEASPDVPEGLVAKVAEAERLWEANARLAKDHLQGTVDDITKLLFTGRCTNPSGCGVAERCQRAIEDIPRLLRPPECPQRVPEVFLMSLELQKLSLALLKHNIAKPSWRRRYSSDLADAPTSLSRALAAHGNTPWTTWAEKGPGEKRGQQVAQVGVHIGGQLGPADQGGHQAPGRLQGHGQWQGHRRGLGRSLENGHRRGRGQGHKRRCCRRGRGCGRGCACRDAGKGGRKDERRPWGC